MNKSQAAQGAAVPEQENYHTWLDRRSLAMHELVAQKIRQNPVLFTRATATLQRWIALRVAQGAVPACMREWETILNQGLDATLAIATDPSENATRLRQSSPFAGILTNDERLVFLAHWKEQNPPPTA